MGDNTFGDRGVRDSVITLETKMDLMTTAVTELTKSVKSLADVRYELSTLQKDFAHIYKNLDNKSAQITSINAKLDTLNASVTKNTFITNKAAVIVSTVITAAITGAVGYLFFLLR